MLTPAQQVQQKIAELQTALHTNMPEMPTLLRTIHTELQRDPEIVTALSPEEIGVIVSGLGKQMNTSIATKQVKSGSRATKGAKNITLDML